MKLQSDLWNIALNVVASTLFLALVTAVAVFRIRRRARKVWQFRPRRAGSIYFVVGTFNPPVTELGYRRSTTTLSDAVALGFICQSLTLAYRSSFKFLPIGSASFSDPIWNETVVLIGGRVRNGATRTLLERAEKLGELRLLVHDDKLSQERCIVDIRTGKTFKATLNGDRIVEDYGIIHRLNSPMRPHEHNPIFCFYGLHAPGTVGAAKLLTPEYSATLKRFRELGTSREFQILVRVVVVEEEVFPTVVDVFTPN